jgi:phthalate 4,5-dioxygenase oxygenase subunit
MLKKEDNELLCRVGPGTAMGQFMREYWVPVLRSARLETAGAPVRVRLLGENFVVFRTADGRVGLFDEACPHRGASLTLARNEGDGLRCAYHGWKLGAGGDLLEVPTEQPARRAQFIARTALRHYPVREGGGIIWTFLGAHEPPEFPHFNFMDLPLDHVRVSVGIINGNWFQGLEGQLDSAHVGILHSDWVKKSLYHDTGPRFLFDPQPYGYREAAVRKMPDGQHYVRVRDYAVPWYSFIPMGNRKDDHLLTVSVPVDDEHSAQWDVWYNFTRPVAPFPRNAPPNLDDNTVGLGTAENGWGQDRQRMREGSWSGMAYLRFEDYAVAASQGPIVDRSREYLGSSDTSVNRARRLLLDAVRRFAKGEPAMGLDRPVAWGVMEAQDAIIAPDADWRDVGRS